MSNKASLILYITLVFCGINTLYAQNQDYDVFQLRFLYNEIKFGDVIVQGNKLLTRPELLSKKELSDIHKFMALSFYNLSQIDSARAHFFSLLSISPKFEPDPVRTSPKIIRFFKEIKTEFLQNSKSPRLLAYKKYVFVEDIRPGAALRSMIFPGWGQLYKHEPSKAYILGGAFWGSALITGIIYAIERDRRSKYLQETNPVLIAKRYDAYNTLSKTRRFMQYSLIGIWALSLSDALFSEYKPQIQVDNTNIGLAVQIHL